MPRHFSFRPVVRPELGDRQASANGSCRVAIADHGPGMAHELRAKAFEAFFTTKHRGTGLGLPTARRMIEAHGGTIELGDTAGGGTTVLISLPVGPHNPP